MAIRHLHDTWWRLGRKEGNLLADSMAELKLMEVL